MYLESFLQVCLTTTIDDNEGPTCEAPTQVGSRDRIHNTSFSLYLTNALNKLEYCTTFSWKDSILLGPFLSDEENEVFHYSFGLVANS